MNQLIYLIEPQKLYLLNIGIEILVQTGKYLVEMLSPKYILNFEHLNVALFRTG